MTYCLLNIIYLTSYLFYFINLDLRDVYRTFKF